MANPTAAFVWYELMTTDPQAAEAFYRTVVGWTAQDSGMTDQPYTIVSAGATPVGGLMPIPDEARKMGAGPAWTGYIGVADVDGSAAAIRAAGGAVLRAAQDIPNVGRFAVVADPQGAAFMLFKGSTDPAPVSAEAGALGHVGWRELHASDGAKAFEFYSAQFGWTKGEAMDMGAMGSYQLFATGGTDSVGGMMTKMPEQPVPAWLFYFNVEAIDAAVERVNDSGGKVVNGPMEVPGGSWIVNCVDPQGAMFALVGTKR